MLQLLQNVLNGTLSPWLNELAGRWVFDTDWNLSGFLVYFWWRLQSASSFPGWGCLLNAVNIIKLSSYYFDGDIFNYLIFLIYKYRSTCKIYDLEGSKLKFHIPSLSVANFWIYNVNTSVSHSISPLLLLTVLLSYVLPLLDWSVSEKWPWRAWRFSKSWSIFSKKSPETYSL